MQTVNYFLANRSFVILDDKYEGGNTVTVDWKVTRDSDGSMVSSGSVDQVFNNHKCEERGEMLYLNKTNTGYEKWKQGAYTVTVGFNKYSKPKKKNRTISRSKVITIKNKKTKITYIKRSGNKKIKINKKTGKVTVRKGLKKGTYKIVVAVTAAESAVYKSRTKKVTFRIRVK